MGGAAEYPERSSSPLKRRAASMDPDVDMDVSAKDDVDMISLPPEHGVESGADMDVEGSIGAPNGLSEQQQAGGGEDAGAGQAGSEGGGGIPKMAENEIPALPQQIREIESIIRAFNEQPLQEGDTVYLVSRRWLNRAQALGGDVTKATKDAVKGPLGPVDNSDIIEGTVEDIEGKAVVRLKPGMGLENFELFPKQAWELVVGWHGLAEGQLPIIRTAHNTSPESLLPNVQVELHPPVFTVHRLWNVNSGLPTDREVGNPDVRAAIIMCSSSYSFQAFLRRLKALAQIPMERPVRVWRVPRKLPAGETEGGIADLNSPQDSWPRLLLSVTAFVKLEKGSDRDLLDVKDSTNDDKYNGRSVLAFFGLTVDQTLVLDESVERTLWVSTYRGPKSAGKEKAITTRGSATSLASQARTNNGSGRNSPAPSQGPVTRGRAKRKPDRTIGCVGLVNLGNTCYMNSALQCVRSVEELTKYFLLHENYREINEDNPLGHGGNVANVYGALLDDIYRDPPPPSVSPRTFKATIGRYAPAFSGYGQQDSQEFLGFLLDGLQEDLSRVKKKPYIEKPDSTDDMINNPAAIREMAEKVWDITKKRDDSVIADLFTGMYKSTLICPVCQKISITFDPFTNLTLPLPMQNMWSKQVKYVPLNDAPVLIDMDLDKTTSIKAMKEYISARVGVPAARLFAAEEWKERFFKVYDDFASVADEIPSSDSPVVFELEAAPTNTSPKLVRKKNRSMLNTDDLVEIPPWDDPIAERMLVPVFHRFAPNDQSYRRRLSKTITSVTPPHFIVLTPEEARNEDAIRRKILEKVASYSTWSEFSAADDTDPEDSTDQELVAASASDADSAGDGKVVAKSVEGEDDLVDVSMKDAGETTPPVSVPSYPKLLKKFNNRRPKWVNPSVYLIPELQNLFEMSYFSEGDTIIPCGWSGINEDKVYPRLDSRAPPPPAPVDLDRQSPVPWTNGTGSDNDSTAEEISAVPMNGVTRMTDESDESDDFSPPAIQPSQPHLAYRDKGNNKVGYGRRKTVRPAKTYGSKKGSKRRGNKHLQSVAAHQRQMVQADYGVDGADAAGPDDGPLVRLGEGIIVEWNPNAWDAVYGGDQPGDSRGTPTFAEPLPELEDPELQEKRRMRASRKKNGLTLDECLDEFEKEEILSEQDTWYCPRCKEHRRASKKFDLWKTPDILVVHLKRFSSSGFRRDKLDTRVDCPVLGLDLTRRVLDKQTGKQEVYDLFAIDDHWGGLGGGHYTAFARNFIDGQWYEYNDSSVSKVNDPERMVTSAAYLLFYRRRSEVPLGGPRFQEIVERYNRESRPDDEGMSSESGEDQRLGVVSSQPGSSSASKGAEATRRRASLGLAASSKALTAGVGAHTLPELLPSYQQASGAGDESGDGVGDDDAQPLLGSSVLNFGSSIEDNKNPPIRRSIESDEGADEGIGMSPIETAWQQQQWSFESIGLGSGPKVPSAASQAAPAANSSDTDVDSMGPGVGDPDDKMTSFDAPEGYAEPPMPTEGEPPSYDEPPPLLDQYDQAAMEVIRNQAWDSKVHAVVPADVGRGDQESEKAVDIHISEEEEAKMG